MPTDRSRRESWLVSYQVDVTFDTDPARTRYDHVGTLARCHCCGDTLDLPVGSGALERHARRHQVQLSTDGHPSNGDQPEETLATTISMTDFITETKEVTARD